MFLGFLLVMSAAFLIQAQSDFCQTWGDWGSCSVTCDGGIQSRACLTANLFQYQECNTGDCYVQFSAAAPGLSVALSWRTRADKISFSMNATRDAWISIGFDPIDSGMDQADMAVLMKSNSTPPTFSIQDRWSAVSPPPKVDIIQNLEDTSGGTVAHNGTMITWMTFARSLDTKDISEDKIIRLGPIGVVWAVGSSWDFAYHGVTRGYQLLTLLNPPQDCVFNPWSNWSGCVGTCASSIQTRTRSTIQPRRGGAACQGPSSDSKSCTLPECTAKPAPEPTGKSPEFAAPAPNADNSTNPAPSNVTVNSGKYLVVPIVLMAGLVIMSTW